MSARVRLSEAQAERLIDRIVMRRLATDRAYQHAENSERQTERELEITARTEREIAARFEIT